MDVKQMRIEIEKVYPGNGWKNKVSKMLDDQVIAIHKEFTENGKLGNPKIAHVDDGVKLAVTRATQVEIEDIMEAAQGIVMYPIDEVHCTIRMTYEDIELHNQIVCPAEVLKKMWLQMLGEVFLYEGVNRRITSVRDIANFIFVDLETVQMELKSEN